MAVSLALLLPMPLAAQDQRALAVIPRPERVTPKNGRFVFDSSTVIVVSRETAGLGTYLSQLLAPATGRHLRVVRREPPKGKRVVLGLRPTLRGSLGAEGYRLAVSPQRIDIAAPALAGVFYGIQTVRQLLPTEIFADTVVHGVLWDVAALDIEDKPRFSWRGGHLDVGRHFMPKEFVKRYIDLLALHKVNRFHWHLTEDQGWRIEIRKYPRLTSVGAWRKETIIGRPRGDSTRWRYDETPHGGFYTQSDIRDVVSYAAERFVTVVPEIEMPGHAMAAIAAYPELGVTKNHGEVWTRWGVTPDILSPEESTIAFMQDVLREVMELFPSRYIHVGGDEAIKAWWRQSPRVQARMRQLKLRNENQLQSWFIKRMDRFLTQHGRRLVGWDEILDGGLASGAVVMSWRGVRGGIAAARAGHDVIMAPTSHTYLDYYQARDQAMEPVAFNAFLPIDTVYAFEPVPPQLRGRAVRRVLGAQGQLWTEYMRTPAHVEYQAFPRMSALAEVVWTPKERKDFGDFLRRLEVHLGRLDYLKVNYRRPEALSRYGAR
jgi:hexosaminidase